VLLLYPAVESDTLVSASQCVVVTLVTLLMAPVELMSKVVAAAELMDAVAAPERLLKSISTPEIAEVMPLGSSSKFISVTVSEVPLIVMSARALSGEPAPMVIGPVAKMIVYALEIWG
jgi:hypothetical protein